MSNREQYLPQIDHLAFPQPAEHLTFTGERYTSNLSGPIRHQHHHRYLFATRFCSGLDVLDVACGEGYGSALLSSVARSVVGVDLDDQTIVFAQRNYAKDNLSFKQGDAAKIQDRESFDVIISFETIEHLVDHEAFLVGLKRALRPGGLLVISSPDKDIYTYEDEHENEFHLKELDRPQFKFLIQAHFGNMAVLEQDSLVGSLISLEGGAPANLEMHSSDNGKSYHRTPGIPRAHYLIAIASDGPLPPLFASALSDMSWVREQHAHQLHAVSLAREVVLRDTEITRLEAENARTITNIQHLAKEVDTKGTEIGRLQEQLAREIVVRDTEITRLEAENARTITNIQHLAKEVDTKGTEIRRLQEQAKEMETRTANLYREINQGQVIMAEQKRYLAEVLTSTSWRLSAPVRYIGRLTASTRRRLRALTVLSAKPAATIRPNSTPRIIFIDWTVPTPDQDSGSLDLWHQLNMFRVIGYDVSFMSIVTRAADRPYVNAIRNIDIDYVPISKDSSPEQVLQDHAGKFDLFILNRIHVADRLIAHLRRLNPDARIIFNTVDLHFLREEREAALERSQEKALAAAQRRVVELRCMTEADATIVLSEEEGRMLSQLVPRATIHVIPFARTIASDCPGFSHRNGVLFIGGFLHSPNVDGALWLAKEIWPRVRRSLPQATLDIIGSNATSEVWQLDNANAGIVVRGFLQDINPAFARARLTTAPLRFGAGIKGKVAMSLAAGVPCVATPVAAEGMGLTDGLNILVERDADEIAATIIRLHEDPKLWARLSEEGQALMRSRYSFQSVGNKFIALMTSLNIAIPPGAEDRIGTISVFQHQE